MGGKASTAPPASSKRSGDTRQRVHIRVEYANEGPPGPLLSEKCDTLVKMMIEADAGVIEGTIRGGGAVDIYVVTRFADSTIERARKIARELGIIGRTTVKIADGKGDG